MRELCLQQIIRDVRYYTHLPLPPDAHDAIYEGLGKSGDLTSESLLPLLRTADHGDALARDIGDDMARMALGSVGLRALAAAQLQFRATAKAEEHATQRRDAHAARPGAAPPIGATRAALERIGGVPGKGRAGEQPSS